MSILARAFAKTSRLFQRNTQMSTCPDLGLKLTNNFINTTLGLALIILKQSADYCREIIFSNFFCGLVRTRRLSTEGPEQVITERHQSTLNKSLVTLVSLLTGAKVAYDRYCFASSDLLMKLITSVALSSTTTKSLLTLLTMMCCYGTKLLRRTMNKH
jgi:hypothetical protein